MNLHEAAKAVVEDQKQSYPDTGDADLLVYAWQTVLVSELDTDAPSAEAYRVWLEASDRAYLAHGGDEDAVDALATEALNPPE